jgi:enoyl-CoA hydratase/carnithine racemase
MRPGDGAESPAPERLPRRGEKLLVDKATYDAELAERYGWINRALPASTLREFVRSLAHRIGVFPSDSRAVITARLDAISLAPIDDFRRN